MFNMVTFFEHFNGGLLSEIFAVISFFSTIISILLYKRKDRTFSFFTHWLPTYGDTVPKTVAHIFNTNVIVLSPLMALFILYLSSFLGKMGAGMFLISIVAIIGCIASTGQFFVGIIPANYSYKVHAFAALFFFGGTALYGILISIIELMIGFPIYIPLFGFFMALSFFIFLVLLIVINVDATKNQSLPAIWEWLSYFSLIIWVFLHGIFLLRTNS